MCGDSPRELESVPMRVRGVDIALGALVFLAAPAHAGPQIRVSAVDGVANIELVGSYPQSHFTVYRADNAAGPWRAITDFDVLCLASCFATDFTAEPGRTYWYRFDLLVPPGSFQSLGPFEATIPSSLSKAIGARVIPNPSHGPAGIEVYLAGAPGAEPLQVVVRILDVQGRTVRALFAGALPRGLSQLRWDGLDDAGRAARPGTYFVVTRSPLGSATTRMARVR